MPWFWHLCSLMLFSFEFQNAKMSKIPKMPKWSKCQGAKKKCQNQKMIESRCMFSKKNTKENLGKFSKHRPSDLMLSISWFFYKCVGLSVCVSACSLLRYHLNIFFPPTSRSQMSKFLEIQNPWGKVMERSGLRIKKKY